MLRLYRREEQPNLDPEENFGAPEQDCNRIAASAVKKEGNEAFQRRNFSKARRCYSTAIRIAKIQGWADPVNFLNRAACDFELGDLDSCIFDCKESVRAGLASGASWRLLAKAHTRCAKAFMKQSKVDAAETSIRNALRYNPQSVKALRLFKVVEEKKRAAAMVEEDMEFEDIEVYAPSRQLNCSSPTEDDLDSVLFALKEEVVRFDDDEDDGVVSNADSGDENDIPEILQAENEDDEVGYNELAEVDEVDEVFEFRVLADQDCIEEEYFGTQGGARCCLPSHRSALEEEEEWADVEEEEEGGEVEEEEEEEKEEENQMDRTDTEQERTDQGGNLFSLPAPMTSSMTARRMRRWRRRCSPLSVRLLENMLAEAEDLVEEARAQQPVREPSSCGNEEDEVEEMVEEEVDIEKSESKQSESKQSESKQSESKQSESKQSESKQSESKQSESKQSESKQSESKQSESKQSEYYVELCGALMGSLSSTLALSASFCKLRPDGSPAPPTFADPNIQHAKLSHAFDALLSSGVEEVITATLIGLEELVIKLTDRQVQQQAQQQVQVQTQQTQQQTERQGRGRGRGRGYNAQSQPWHACIAEEEKACPETSRLLLMMFDCRLLAESNYQHSVLPKLCAALYSSPAADQKLLEIWWSEMPSDRLSAVIACLNHYLTRALYSAGISAPVFDVLHVLSILHKSVERAAASAAAAACDGVVLVDAVVPFTAFYNKAVNEDVDLREEYRRWRLYGSSIGGTSSMEPALARSMLSICHYPFVLEPSAKTRIFHFDAALQMQGELEAVLLATAAAHNSSPASSPPVSSSPSSSSPSCPSSSSSASVLSSVQESAATPIVQEPSVFVEEAVPSPFLVFRVRREHIVADTLIQMAHTHPADLKKPLKLHFEHEEGVDEGGVQKEFFQILVRQLFSPASRMFGLESETQQHFFLLDPSPSSSSSSSASSSRYRLVGALLGLALYNGVILDVRFPLAIYKKLLGVAPTLADLHQAQPALARGLQQLLDYDGEDVESVFMQSFEVTTGHGALASTVELKPGGKDIPVTNSNRVEFVERYVHHALSASIRRQFTAFGRGFHAVCGGECLQLFRPEELELLVCGTEELDFAALQAVTQYEGGFTATSPCVVAFWEVVHDLPVEKKRKLLSFVSGSSRVPIKGLAQMAFTIVRQGPDSQRLPTSHTCYNQLLLPEYSTPEKLQSRLEIALCNCEGFGLQ
jgi:ubiquitin-protein ligase E3 A